MNKNNALKLSIVHPKTKTELSYMGECFVRLKPRQKWVAIKSADDNSPDANTVLVTRENVTLKLKLTQYKMFFKEVKEND